MPELPEVETVRRILLPRLKDRKITDIHINNARIISAPSPADFVNAVKGQTIAGFIRKGKFLRFVFASGDILTFHFRMTGCLTVEQPEAPCEKHTHLVFILDDGNELRYEDTRRLGKFWFASKGDKDTSGMDDLGTEPFDGAENLKALKEKCGNSKKPVKQVLLDQSVIAGIGNIYSQEGLIPRHLCRKRKLKDAIGKTNLSIRK